MTTAIDTCSFIVSPSSRKVESEINELRRILEGGDEVARINAMESALVLLSSGNAIASTLVMTIIRFVMPNQRNKLLKKLVLLYFEMVPKTDAEGKLLSEMILLCNALRNDLQHPNEYVRGVTLRFLTRIKEPEILEPLVPSIRSCLNHNHEYVRRNAICALYSVYRTNDYLVPDAPELLEELLEKESNDPCRRNAFVFLNEIDPEKADKFFSTINEERLSSMESSLQLAIIDYLRLDSARNESNLSRNIRCIARLLQSGSSSVKFQAASTLMVLSNSTVVLKAVASTYVDLASKETDNNAKLIALDKFQELQRNHSSIINEQILDLLRVLSAPDFTVRKRALDLVMAGIGARHANELVAFLVKELGQVGDYDWALSYKQCLLASINSCGGRFPVVAQVAVSCFVDLLMNTESGVTVDAIKYCKEILERIPSLRNPTISQLLDAIDNLKEKDSKALNQFLWVIGEYSSDPSTIESSFSKIQSLIGPIPIKEDFEVIENVNTTSSGQKTQRKLNPDGTYATETALTSKSKDFLPSNIPLLRRCILEGPQTILVSLGSTVTKLALLCESQIPEKFNSFKAFAMLIITSILKLGASKLDKDSFDRLLMNLKLLSRPSEKLQQAFIIDSRKAFDEMLQKKDSLRGDRMSLRNEANSAVDKSVQFRLTSSTSEEKTITLIAEDMKKDVQLAIDGKSGHGPRLISVLSKVIQLTGFSDEIYAETYFTVNQSDIILDILLVNQTEKTLQNVTIDLGCSGDMKVNEKPPLLTLSPLGFAVAKAAFKVKTTENSLIFGCITYGVTDINSIVLNAIHVDISEYIKPNCPANFDFRSLWTKLEWENKINVPSISDHDLSSVMEVLLNEGHLLCLTPSYGISDFGDYLAANMVATSTFGEEILANICLEKDSSGIVSGHLRLRSKTQGIAIALGERITEIVTKMAQLSTSSN